MAEDSPYQDFKDAKDSFLDGMKKTDDFARHSTGRVIGPAATKALNAIKKGAKALLTRWTTPRIAEEDQSIDV